MTQAASEPGGDRDRRRTLLRIAVAIGLATSALAVLIVALVVSSASHPAHGQQDPPGDLRYLGVYEPDAPDSYAGTEEFAHAIGRQPNLAVYYSKWLQPFQTDFAASAAENHATTLVQIGTGIAPLASVADGKYDSYLRSYASEVKAFGAPVVLSFDHEMNGDWYSWGYKNESPAAFVAAWRHVVTIFREQGVANVTWMWTINIFNTSNLESGHVAAPDPWWPGGPYVNWVGLDGYYAAPATEFDALFGPAIADVRTITSDPMLIAETGASQSAGQSEKISQIFKGASTYGLLGFVLFDTNGANSSYTWRIISPSVFATLRREAKVYMAPSPRTINQR